MQRNVDIEEAHNDSPTNLSVMQSRNEETLQFPELNRSINKMDQQMSTLNNRMKRMHVGRKEEFNHAKILERKK